MLMPQVVDNRPNMLPVKQRGIERVPDRCTGVWRHGGRLSSIVRDRPHKQSCRHVVVCVREPVMMDSKQLIDAAATHVGPP